MDDAAFAGAVNAPDAGGAGVPDVPDAGVGIPSVAQGSPVAPAPSPNAAAILGLQQKLAAMQNPPAAAAPSKLAQVLKFLVPLVGASVAAGRGMGAEGWAEGAQKADAAQIVKQRAAALQADQDAQAQERISQAIHQLQQEDISRESQKRQIAQAQAVADETKRKNIHETLSKALGDESTREHLQGMLDAGGDPTKIAMNTEFGNFTLDDAANRLGIPRVDGKLVLQGAKPKSIDNVIPVETVDPKTGLKTTTYMTKDEAVKGGARITGLPPREPKEPREPNPTPQFLVDKDGNTHAVQFVNGQAREIPMPEGLTKKLAGSELGKKLGTDAATIENIDTGLQEAHRLRDVLKKSGLDQTDNPLGPWTAKFLAERGINDGEASKILQNAQFDQQTLFRAMGGGMRSKALYEAMSAHLPGGNQSGKQLASILDEVDREYQNKRHNILRVRGVKDEEFPLEEPYRAPAGKSFFDVNAPKGKD
jgi:hypothetical protein